MRTMRGRAFERLQITDFMTISIFFQHLLRREHASGPGRGFRGDHSGELCDGESVAGLGPGHPHHAVLLEGAQVGHAADPVG